MTKMTRLLVAATFCLVALTASRASAQSCSADTDCPQSFVCAVSGTSAPPACKGTDCPTDTGASEPVVYKSCQPKVCVADADCGSGMVCYEEKSTSCSGSGGTASGCAPNTKCDAGPVITPVETCTTTTRSICAFKWQVPCNTDTDCGDAFVCDPTVAGGCGTASRSGNSSSPPAADGGAPDCPIMTSFPGTCRAKATTCTADSECPSGWTCTAIGTPIGAGTPVSIAKDASAAPPADSVDPGQTGTKICIGPFGAGGPTRGGVDVGTGGQPTDSTHQGADAAIPPGSPGAGATGGTTGGPSATSGLSAGGCSMAPSRGGDSAFLLIGLATVGLVLARRRRLRD